MKLFAKTTALMFSALVTITAQSEVVDLQPRPGVTLRGNLLAASNPTAAAILLVGGDGGLQISNSGAYQKLAGNFLARTAPTFSKLGLEVLVLDAPSDRMTRDVLYGFRQDPRHAIDIQSAISYLRSRGDRPVWLIGTSRGTESAVFAATQLNGKQGPDGIVLTSSILQSRPEPGRGSVNDFEVEKISIPVLLVHHENDACEHTVFPLLAPFRQRLTASSKAEVKSYTGGTSTGEVCGAKAHHGYNGIETQVVSDIVTWVADSQRKP
jgi:hypothetical protein